MNISLSPYVAGKNYDLAFSVCGYEARSAHFLDVEAPRGKRLVAAGYGSHEVLSFKKNRRRFKDSRYSVSSVADSDFTDFFRGLVHDAAAKSANPEFFVDISCLTRLRLANIIEALSEVECEVDFAYSLAKFSPPARKQLPNEYLEPVSPYFSGWSGDIDRPIAVISGLGYEYMRAIGTIEFLDASDVWLFFPTSPLPEYDKEVTKANELLLSEIEPSRVIRYPVEDFLTLCRSLFSLTASLRSSHRCALLPLGPKQFALGALLAGSMFRDVSVWRASAGEFAEPVERFPSDKHFRVRVVFSQSPSGT